jgi:hypothetical protein
MKRWVLMIAAVVLTAACAGGGSGSGWVTLIDGDRGMENFDQTGDANWRAEGGAIVADKASVSSFLVTKS